MYWSKLPVTPGVAHGFLTSRKYAYWSTESFKWPIDNYPNFFYLPPPPIKNTVEILYTMAKTICMVGVWPNKLCSLIVFETGCLNIKADSLHCLMLRESRFNCCLMLTATPVIASFDKNCLSLSIKRMYISMHVHIYTYTL